MIDKFAFSGEEELTYISSLQYKMYLDPKTYLAKHLYYFGIYEPMTVQLLKTVLAPGMIFYDIGANVGFYSLLAAKRILPNGIAYAFEPQSKCCFMLKRSAEINGLGNIRICQTALSDVNEQMMLYQLSKTNIGQACLWAQGVNIFGSEKVRCTTLDHLIIDEGLPPCDIMKIDVEGAEFKVLQGGNLLLSNSPPKVIVLEGIDEHLKRFGSCLEYLIKILIEHKYKIAFARKGSWHPFISINNYKRNGSPPDFLAMHDSFYHKNNRKFNFF